MIGFLLDENVDPVLRKELVRHAPDIIVWRVGDPATVPLSTSDPEILRWCERHDALLVTYNRSSMPVHLRDHIAEGGHVPGIVLLEEALSIGEVVEELLLIWGASFPEEHRDSFVYVRRIKRMD
ncbi:MAG TPA: DUF5615 family PIN-like protein [Chloroflexia bacterium]